MPYDVITVGAAVLDVYLESDAFKVEKRNSKSGSRACFLLGEKVEVRKPTFSSGGGATNAAATFAHLGFRVGCVAKIGNDHSGHIISKDLELHGVHTDLLVRCADETTGYPTLLTAPNGERTAMVFRGASGSLSSKDIPWSHIRANWLYITSLNGDFLLFEKLLNHAISHGIKVAWNPGVRELESERAKIIKLISKVDLTLLNTHEAAALTGLPELHVRFMLGALSKRTEGMIVITAGPKGTFACRKDVCFHAEPNDVPVINTTGSGDAFGGAFVAGLMAYDSDIVGALRLGTLNAESVIQKVGAKNGILERMPGSRRLSQIIVEPYKIE
ncbi:MAG: carbohydrate kinase family protein [Patescibacteria group bacterium]